MCYLAGYLLQQTRHSYAGPVVYRNVNGARVPSGYKRNTCCLQWLHLFSNYLYFRERSPSEFAYQRTSPSGVHCFETSFRRAHEPVFWWVTLSSFRRPQAVLVLGPHLTPPPHSMLYVISHHTYRMLNPHQ